MPTLYKLDLSPPARAVLMCEKALGIQLKHVDVDVLNEEHLKSEFVKINPQHTIPTFIDDDGTVIWDSHAIMSYMCDKYGKDDSLYPKNLAKRALVNQRMHFESGIVFALCRRIIIMLRAGKPINSECIEQADSTYDFLNQFLENTKWVAGDHITIADFSLLSSITVMNLGMLPIEEKYGNILKWIKNAEELPYYQEVIGKELKQSKDFIEALKKCI